MTSEEAKGSLLVDENARLLTLFPALASRLLKSQRCVDQIYEYINQLLQQEDDATLRQVKEDIEKLDKERKLKNSFYDSVDSNKTILLTYAFGDMYTQALSMATGGNIRADVLNAEELRQDQLEELVRQFMTGNQSEKMYPIFLRVYNNIIDEHVAVKERNHWLELRRMLGKVGATLNLDTKKVGIDNDPSEEIGRVWPEGEYTSVDPYNWFCSSEEFICDSGDDKEHISSEQLLEGYERNEVNEPLFNFLLKRGPKVPKKLPICTQLLAVLIAAYNYESIPIQIKQISEPWQVLEALSIN
ncbi:hypothetical protein FDK38_003176 [Candidozyma auris]|nr:hypothetical protein FDK38_003176 [[Candida] auris]